MFAAEPKRNEERRRPKIQINLNMSQFASRNNCLRNFKEAEEKSKKNLKPTT